MIIRILIRVEWKWRYKNLYPSYILKVEPKIWRMREREILKRILSFCPEKFQEWICHLSALENTVRGRGLSDGHIKSSVLDMLSLWCILHIQVEGTRKTGTGGQGRDLCWKYYLGFSSSYLKFWILRIPGKWA